MELEEVYRALSAALRKINQDSTRNEQQVAALTAIIEQLVEVLIAKEVLGPGHRRVFAKTGERGAAAVKPKVRLRVIADKYQITGPQIDCAARFHLCHARCCSFSFELSRQDLDEGKILWEIEDPYLIRHELDGYCSHLDRKTLFCTIHAERPGTCRGYDCRGDKRVWIDFDARIPAPMQPELLPP